LPLSADQEVTQSELEREGSLYSLLEAKFNLIVAEADETIEATIADEKEAALLEVPIASALLLVERTSWSHLRRPMEYVKMLYRADHYTYAVHMTR
jgi:GntR family transcriptional regulator